MFQSSTCFKSGARPKLYTTWTQSKPLSTYWRKQVLIWIFCHGTLTLNACQPSLLNCFLCGIDARYQLIWMAQWRAVSWAVKPHPPLSLLPHLLSVRLHTGSICVHRPSQGRVICPVQHPSNPPVIRPAAHWTERTCKTVHTACISLLTLSILLSPLPPPLSLTDDTISL